MIRIRIETQGLQKAITGLDKFIRQLNDRSTVLRKIKRDQIRRWSTNFLTEGGEYGAWEPTSGETRGASGQTLYQSGGTYRFFMELNEEGDVDQNSIQWDFYNANNGRGGQYPVSHHTGYMLGSNYVPARILWELDGQDEERIRTDLARWVSQVAERTLG